MDTKTKIVLLLNLIFVVILLTWPIINAPKIQINLDRETVPLGGKLEVRATFPSVPSSAKLYVVDLELNKTVYTLNLKPAKEVSAKLYIEEGKYRIGHYVIKIKAMLDGSSIEGEDFFNVFGGSPLNLTLRVEKPEIDAFINVTSKKQYAEVNDEVRAKVTMNGEPVKDVKLLALTLGRNATVTDVVYTNASGEGIISWKANVTDNETYSVIVQAVKPGHPIASGEVQIKVNVRKGS